MKNFKTKTRQEMAAEFGVCRKTFYSMLKKEAINIKGRLIFPKEQEIIYQKFGEPKK